MNVCPECSVDLDDVGQPHSPGCTVYAAGLQDLEDEAAVAAWKDER